MATEEILLDFIVQSFMIVVCFFAIRYLGDHWIDHWKRNN